MPKIPKPDSTSENNPKQPRPMLELALWYASEGVAVFPLMPGQKKPVLSGGFKSATRDETQIRSWWEQHPNANIGGHPGANQVVLDVDGPDHNDRDDAPNGFESLNGRDLPETFKCYTGSGGEHHWFTLPDDGEEYKTTQAGALPGVDLRGAKGYVVLPGSIHPNGQPYLLDVDGKKADPRTMDELPALRGVSVAPGWLLDLCRGPNTGEPLKERGKATEGIFRASLRAGLIAKYKDEAQVGTRNNTLFRYVCEARRQGLDMEQDWLAVGQEVGLTSGEVQATLSSAAQAEPMGTDHLEREIAREMERLQVREEASRRFRERKNPVNFADVPRLTLAELLERDLGEEQYVVDQLWPEGGKVLFAAPPKAGKSTLVGNLIRCLADGGKYLDRFDVAQVERVALVDTELSYRILQNWLRDQEIQNPDRVELYPLIGQAGGFDLMSDAKLDAWAEALKDVDVLFLDVLSPVFTAMGVDENTETGPFLDRLTELKRKANIGALMVVHHTGHEGTRARGDSRLMGWSDANWVLRPVSPGQPDSVRLFHVTGRDAALAETPLKYENRRYSIASEEELAQERLAQAAQEQLEAERKKRAEYDERKETWDRRIQDLLAYEREQGEGFSWSRNKVRKVARCGADVASQLKTALESGDYEFPYAPPRELKHVPRVAREQGGLVDWTGSPYGPVHQST